MKIHKVEVYICDLNDDGMSTPKELEVLIYNHKYICGEMGRYETVEVTEEEFDNGINLGRNDTLEEYRKLFKRDNK